MHTQLCSATGDLFNAMKAEARFTHTHLELAKEGKLDVNQVVSGQNGLQLDGHLLLDGLIETSEDHPKRGWSCGRGEVA